MKEDLRKSLNQLHSIISGSFMGTYISLKCNFSWYIGSLVIFFLPLLIYFIMEEVNKRAN